MHIAIHLKQAQHCKLIILQCILNVNVFPMYFQCKLNILQKNFFFKLKENK